MKKGDLYHHQLPAVNNFESQLPEIQSQLAQQIIRENYDFSFATVQHAIYDEAELEEALRLRCYVVVELKAKAFAPEFAGKLNFYVNLVDDAVRQPEDNPTIGLLICSDMDKAEVQWSFRGINTPLGVATYNNINIREVLPSQQLLQERMQQLQKELTHTKKLLGKGNKRIK